MIAAVTDATADHAGRGWRDKSKNSGPTDQAPRLVIEWTADL